MIVARFAPSPSGLLHLGHAYSAAIGHARARQAQGKFRLRIEDLDQTRCRPEFVDGIGEDLRWLALEWDEPMLVQSQRVTAYEAALEELKSRGLVLSWHLPRAA
jgi:glutamyl-Q tRNA(Asp) synthetase